MDNFTSIKPFPIWNIEQQQKRLGTTDKDRAKKRESLKYKRIKNITETDNDWILW